MQGAVGSRYVRSYPLFREQTERRHPSRRARDEAIEGVPEVAAIDIDRNISNITNNPNLLNMLPLAEFERLHGADGKLAIWAWVPMGLPLYTLKGAVRDRVVDADMCEKRCPNHLDDGLQAGLLLGASCVPLGDRG